MVFAETCNRYLQSKSFQLKKSLLSYDFTFHSGYNGCYTCYIITWILLHVMCILFEEKDRKEERKG